MDPCRLLTRMFADRMIHITKVAADDEADRMVEGHGPYSL